MLTDESNVEFHFGLIQHPRFASQWITELRRLAAFRDVKAHPPTRREVRAALMRGERELNSAYKLDPLFYPGYQCYFAWLTLDVSNNPEVSEAWKGGEDDDDDDDGDSNHRDLLSKEIMQEKLNKALLLSDETLKLCDIKNSPDDCLMAAAIKVNLFVYTADKQKWKSSAPIVAREIEPLLHQADTLASTLPWWDATKPASHKEDFKAWSRHLWQLTKLMAGTK